ncbi:MAG: transcription antitermination factor NusB [Lachnospiraceae bacterium]|nr:transcription antitermination factor NusB [Lachnospiraceae bacterium]
MKGKISEMDPVIEKCSKGWKLNRIGNADITILRLAIYEMKYDDNVPVKVAINEAVELAKRYGMDNSPGFINGILANVAKQHEEG